MSRFVPYLIIAILTVVVIVLYNMLQDKDLAAQAQRSVHQKELELSEARRIAVETRSDSIVTSERHFRTEAKEKDSLREVSYKRELKASKLTIAQLRAERSGLGITPDSSTVKIEAEFQDQQERDSVEIETLKANGSLAEKSFQSEIQAITDKLTAERETSLKKDVVIDDLQKEVNKLTKRNNWLKTTTWISIGVAVVELLIILL